MRGMHEFEPEGPVCKVCGLPRLNRRMHPQDGAQAELPPRTPPPPPPPEPSLFDPPPPPRRKPIVRNDDPPNSHIAAASYEPVRDTVKGKVRAFLEANRGRWIEPLELAQIASSGERRMRELRDEGLPVESRPNPAPGVLTWQHRLPAE